MSMFSEIINPFLNVRNQIKNKSGQWVDMSTPKEETKVHASNNRDITGDTEIIIFEHWDRKIVLEGLVLASNAEMSPHLYVKPTGSQDYLNDVFRSIQDHLGIGFATPRRISESDNNHDYLDLVKYDGIKDGVPSGSYMVLKRPVVMGHGGKLVIQGNEEYTGNAIIKVVWREIRE